MTRFLGRLGQAIVVFMIVRATFAALAPAGSLGVDLLKSVASIAIAALVVGALAKATIRSKLWHRAWIVIAIIALLGAGAGVYVAASRGVGVSGGSLAEALRDIVELLAAVGLAGVVARWWSTRAAAAS